jgi:hypothetical protein
MQRPRAMLPGGSGQLLPTLRQAGWRFKHQLSPSPPGQLQRDVRPLERTAPLESIGDARGCGNPQQDRDPDTAGEKVVVTKQGRPRVAHDEMAEDEFEDNGEKQADRAEAEGLMRRAEVELSENEPDVRPEEEDEAHGRQVVCG